MLPAGPRGRGRQVLTGGQVLEYQVNFDDECHSSHMFGTVCLSDAYKAGVWKKEVYIGDGNSTGVSEEGSD